MKPSLCFDWLPEGARWARSKFLRVHEYIRFNSFWPSCFKWSCTCELKFLSYNHTLSIGTKYNCKYGVLPQARTSFSSALLPPLPSPSDDSHAGCCKHKRLTVIIIAIISYEFTIQLSPFFQSTTFAPKKQSLNKPAVQEAKKTQVRTFTHSHFNNFFLHAGSTQLKDWKLLSGLWQNLEQNELYPTQLAFIIWRCPSLDQALPKQSTVQGFNKIRYWRILTTLIKGAFLHGFYCGEL